MYQIPKEIQNLNAGEFTFCLFAPRFMGSIFLSANIQSQRFPQPQMQPRARSKFGSFPGGAEAPLGHSLPISNPGSRGD